MKITKNNLKRIIREEKEKLLDEIDVSSVDEVENGDHHWPRVDWTNVENLTDKWMDLEVKSFDKNDPSQNPEDMTDTDAKTYWEEQVESAAMDFEADLVAAIRKLALAKMKEYSDRLMQGDYG